jgi:hypothetical protein
MTNTWQGVGCWISRLRRDLIYLLAYPQQPVTSKISLRHIYLQRHLFKASHNSQLDDENLRGVLKTLLEKWQIWKFASRTLSSLPWRLLVSRRCPTSETFELIVGGLKITKSMFRLSIQKRGECESKAHCNSSRKWLLDWSYFHNQKRYCIQRNNV